MWLNNGIHIRRLNASVVYIGRHESHDEDHLSTQVDLQSIVVYPISSPYKGMGRRWFCGWHYHPNNISTFFWINATKIILIRLSWTPPQRFLHNLVNFKLLASLLAINIIGCMNSSWKKTGKWGSIHEKKKKNTHTYI